jgi:hypothetical protein
MNEFKVGDVITRTDNPKLGETFITLPIGSRWVVSRIYDDNHVRIEGDPRPGQNRYVGYFKLATRGISSKEDMEKLYE